MEKHELIALLDDCGVPHRQMWDRIDEQGKRWKSVDELLTEINRLEVVPYKRENGRFGTFRERSFIHVEFVHLPTLETFKVEEKFRLHKDGTPETRKLRPAQTALFDDITDFGEPSLSETVERGKTPLQTALQALIQELRIRRPARRRLTFLRYVPKTVRDSRAYFGIDSVEYGHEFHYGLIARECRPIYIERGHDGIATISGWQGDRMPPHIRHMKARITPRSKATVG